MGSGLKTWASGDVLSAADMNNYVGTQVVITCTSGTRPGSPVDGMTIFETDTNSMLVRLSGAWYYVHTTALTSYTPSYTNVTKGNGTDTARYYQIGKRVVYKGKLTWGSTTSYGGAIRLGLPLTCDTTYGAVANINVKCTDASTSAVYWAGGSVGSAGSDVLVKVTGTSGNDSVNATTPFTWTTSDTLEWRVEYEVA